jgi:hypothetical protein
VYGDKTLSIKLTNWISELVKTRWQKGLVMLWLLLSPMFRQTGRETVNEACIKIKALARSLEIFKPKRSGVPSQDFGSITGMTPQSSLPQSRSLKAVKASRWSATRPFSQKAKFCIFVGHFREKQKWFSFIFSRNFIFVPNLNLLLVLCSRKCTTCHLFGRCITCPLLPKRCTSCPLFWEM